MNLKFETIVQIFRKIIELNAVIILKSANEYYRKSISKSGRKMDLYPALNSLDYVCLYIYVRKLMYRSGTVNSNMINSKFSLNSNYLIILITVTWYLKCTVYSIST